MSNAASSAIPEVAVTVTVLASNGRTIARAVHISEDLWNDPALDRGSIIDSCGKQPCRDFAKQEGVDLLAATWTIDVVPVDECQCRSCMAAEKPLMGS